MRRALSIFVCAVWLVGPGAWRAHGQMPTSSASSSSSNSVGDTRTVDAMAARIEDDVLTESEVRELAAFQQLVDGHAKPRADLIRELADQWLVRGEADAAKYPQPSSDDVNREYARLLALFPSPDEFEKRCVAAGLTEAAVRRMLAQQLYLSRFLDYRFRPAAQVDDKQVETYYNDEFAPQLKSRGQPVPPLDAVEDSIREVLVQRAIGDRAAQWMDDSRARLRIDVMPEGDHQ